MLLRTNWVIPDLIPSLIEPRIAIGPITKSSEALTKPSTKGAEPFASNLFLSRTPKLSSRSSIRSREPTSAPKSSAASTVSRAPPVGSSETNLESHNALIESAATRSVTNPRTVVIKSRVFSLNLAPARSPRLDPAMMHKTLITVPNPMNIPELYQPLPPLRPRRVSSPNALEKP